MTFKYKFVYKLSYNLCSTNIHKQNPFKGPVISKKLIIGWAWTATMEPVAHSYSIQLKGTTDQLKGKLIHQQVLLILYFGL
jgi:hypothetical protein